MLVSHSCSLLAPVVAVPLAVAPQRQQLLLLLLLLLLGFVALALPTPGTYWV